MKDDDKAGTDAHVDVISGVGGCAGGTTFVSIRDVPDERRETVAADLYAEKTESSSHVLILYVYFYVRSENPRSW